MDSFEIREDISTGLKNVSLFVERIAGKVVTLTGSADEAFKVKLILEEALTNAMKHGNALDAGKKVKVRVSACAQSIEIDVRDEGKGFDLQAVPDPTEKERSNRPCGRGIYLMRTMTDSLEYYDGGRGIRMLRRFVSRS